MVINDVRAEEHRLLRSNVQVEPCNVRVLAQRRRSVEAETSSIQKIAWFAVSDGEIVGCVFGRCRGNCLNGSRVFAAGVGKDGGNIRRSQGDEATGSIGEFHQSLTQTRQRHGPGSGGLGASVAASLIVVKEEQPVLDDGAAQPTAKSVPDEGRPRSAVQIIEVVIRRSDGIAVRFEQGAVQVVRTALGDQLYLRARRMARSRICSYSRNPELFNRFGV